MLVNNLMANAGVGSGRDGTAPSPRLVRAAHEFEGQMMKELLKPLTAGDGLTGTEDDSDSGGDAGGPLGEFASETLGQALSLHGGLGIAGRIMKTLTQAGNPSGTSKVTGDLHKNTGIRAGE